MNCSENECGKQDHSFKHMSWEPNTYHKTLRNLSQKGILMILSEKPKSLFSPILIKVINCHSHIKKKDIRDSSESLYLYMLEKIFENRL